MGTTTGEALVGKLGLVLDSHKLKGCIVPCTTDCEPSVASTSCKLMDNKV